MIHVKGNARPIIRARAGTCWSDTAGGRRILDPADGAVRTLTTGYDNFPAWSPQGDLIVFSRLADGDFDIFSIRADGTDLRQLTTAAGGASRNPMASSSSCGPTARRSAR